MSKRLSELLGIDDPLFVIRLGQLEQASGHPSADVRLSAEISQRVVQKMRELGLDPSDTTNEELYAALQALVGQHDQFLAKRLGVAAPYRPAHVLAAIKLFIRDAHIPKSAWLLKASSAKRLLKAQPPRKVMKHFHYRSVDSMVKREAPASILLAARLLENAAWQRTYNARYAELGPHDFETRNVEVVLADSEPWHKLAETYIREHRHNMADVKELGSLVLFPLPDILLPGLTVTLLVHVLKRINDIRTSASYLQHHQIDPEFGQILAQSIREETSATLQMAGYDVSWRHVHHHFGRSREVYRPEAFEPHVSPDALAWQDAEETLYRLEPALHFWHGLTYVAVSGNTPVSFNLMDQAISYLNRLSLTAHVTSAYRTSLHDELIERYLQQSPLERQILDQLHPQDSASAFGDLLLERSFA